MSKQRTKKIKRNALRILEMNSSRVFLCNPHNKTPLCKWSDSAQHQAPSKKLLTEASQGILALAVVIPSDIVVIDIDSTEALIELQESCGIEKLPHTTLSVRTGNGWHLYYRWPKGLPDSELKSRVPAFRKIDIRSGRNSRYMIVPPTLHKDRKRHYRYLGKHNRPQRLPKALKRYLRRCYNRAGKKYKSHELAQKSKKTTTLQGGADYMNDKQVAEALDALDPEIFNGTLYGEDGFFQFLAGLHSATSGRSATRKMFVIWAARDNSYNSPENTRSNCAMWDGCKNRKGRCYTVRSVLRLLRKHTYLPPSFYRPIEMILQQEKRNQAFQKSLRTKNSTIRKVL